MREVAGNGFASKQLCSLDTNRPAMCKKLAQIAAVRHHRVGGESTLDAQMLQINIDPFVHGSPSYAPRRLNPKQMTIGAFTLCASAGVAYGLIQMLAPPFNVQEPETEDSPVVVEVPHAGLAIDPETMMWLAAPTHFVARDADLYVDELFEKAAAKGATLLHANYSRYVVDLNRGPNDFDGGTVTGGPALDRPRGLVWRLTSSGMPALRRRLSASELRRRKLRFYDPYHETIQQLLEQKRRRFGFAVMLCAHSMPTPLHGFRLPGRDQNRGIADLVPGTQGRTSCGGEWLDLLEAVGKSHGMSVEHDVPYKGGFSTTHYGRPHEGIHVMQLEIARHLYMNEETCERLDPGFARTIDFANDLVSRLVSAAKAKQGATGKGPLP